MSSISEFFRMFIPVAIYSLFIKQTSLNRKWVEYLSIKALFIYATILSMEQDTSSLLEQRSIETAAPIDIIQQIADALEKVCN